MRCLTLTVSQVCIPHVQFSDRFVDDVDRFDTLQLMNSSPFEQYNGHIKSVYISTLKRHLSSIE